MRELFSRASLLSVLMGLTLGILRAAHAAVDVSFVQPDRFIDIGAKSYDHPAVLKELQKAFQKYGNQYIPANQTLKIDVLDVDLAGRDRLLMPPRDDVRVVTGRADWPSIKLHYTLSADGKVLQSGEETMADLGYREGLVNINHNEPLYYEQQMIGKWFRDHFAKSQNSNTPADQ